MGKREDGIQSGYDAAAAALEHASGDVAAALEPFGERLRKSRPEMQSYLTEASNNRPSPLTPRERAEALVKALPPTVRIGPHDWTIDVMSVEESNYRGLDGHHVPSQAKIRIAASFPLPTQVVTTFLHECLHELFDLSELIEGGKEERVVTILATGLVGLFRDNPWLTTWIASAVKGV